MVKKILCLVLIVMMLLTCVGCSGSTIETEQDDTNKSMFVKVEENYNFDIVYHKDTKVMYAISNGSYNHGTFTVMLDTDGKPLLWEG